MKRSSVSDELIARAIAGGVKVLTTKVPDVLSKSAAEVSNPAPAPMARYTKPGEDGLNRTERAYRDHLEQRKRAGEIHDYRVHAFKLLIVPGVAKLDGSEGVKSVWYTPDFVVFENDGMIAIHETKGYLDQSGEAWLKFKSAVALWPFPFYLVRKVSKAKGTWSIERYAR